MIPPTAKNAILSPSEQGRKEKPMYSIRLTRTDPSGKPATFYASDSDNGEQMKQNAEALARYYFAHRSDIIAVDVVIPHRTNPELDQIIHHIRKESNTMNYTTIHTYKTEKESETMYYYQVNNVNDGTHTESDYMTESEARTKARTAWESLTTANRATQRIEVIEATTNPITRKVLEKYEAPEKLQAIVAYLLDDGETPEEIDEALTETAEGEYQYYNAEYIVLDDTEADERTAEEIKSTLWAFNADFIVEHLPNYYEIFNNTTDTEYGEIVKAFEELQAKLCESANPLIYAIIDDFDEFVADAVRYDGRGHFLSFYDGNETDYTTEEGDTLYIYRTN